MLIDNIRGLIPIVRRAIGRPDLYDCAWTLDRAAARIEELEAKLAAAPAMAAAIERLRAENHDMVIEAGGWEYTIGAAAQRLGCEPEDVVAAVDSLTAENQTLRRLVASAYGEGFGEAIGNTQAASAIGPWESSHTKAALDALGTT